MAGPERKSWVRRGAVLLAVLLLLLFLVERAVRWGPAPVEDVPADVGDAPARTEPPPATEDPELAAGRSRTRVRRAPSSRVTPDSPTTDDEQPPDPASPAPGEAWTVRDRTGLPVFAADVVVVGAGGDAIARLQSDHEGVFRIGDAAAARRLRVSAPGFADLDVAVADGRVLELRGTGRIAGRVLDDAGRTAGDVDLLLRPDAGTWPRTPESAKDAGPWPWTARTGPGGSFLLEDVPPRAMTLVASRVADGSRPSGRCELSGVLPPQDDLVLRLETWPLVTGRVLDAAGRPMAGVSIAMRARMPDGSGGRTWSVSTDQEGRFTCDEVTPENTLWAWSEDHAELAMAVLTDVPPGGAPLDVRLVPGGPLEARVVDASGRPYKGGGTFYVLNAEGRIHNSANFTNGRLRTHVLPFDRRFDLLVHVSTGRSGRLDDVRAGARDLVLQLTKAAPIRGRVLAPDGSPAPAGTIVRAFAVPTSSRSRAGLALEIEAALDGTFTLADIGDLPFTVWAEPGPDMPGSKGIAPSAVVTPVLPGSDVTLQLAPEAVVAGTLDLDGIAAGRRLWFAPEGDLPWHGEAKTEAGGRFRARGLTAGVYTVWMVVPPNRTVRLGTVRAPSQDVTLTLPD